MAVDAARSEEAFTSAGAAQVVSAACRVAGLDDEGAELIRFGENALFRLTSAPVVVRVARGGAWLSTARKEVAVSQWLAEEGFPAARIVEDFEQPLVVEGHPVTFWHLITEGSRKATYRELGGILRDLHSMSVPEALTLSSFKPFDKQDLRISRAVIPEDDRNFLRKRWRELQSKYAALRFESARGPVHGDAHTDNLMVDRNGHVYLIDLENFCLDHSEWDLEVSAHEFARLGWVTEEQYAAFARAYGRDLRDWPGFGAMCAVQEFKMTTWLMQNVNESEEIAQEVQQRIASLRDDDAPRHWQPF